MTEPTPSSTTEPDDTSTSDASIERLTGRAGFIADRRSILRVGGFALCAGALAACSSPPVPSVAPSSSTGGSSSATTGSAGATSTSAATSTAAAGGTPVSEVPVGGAAFYPDTSTIVTQPETGVLKAFDMTCPHQQNPVRRVEDGQLVCPSHGSHFDLTTGARVSGPAEQGLTAKTVTVTGDTFTVS